MKNYQKILNYFASASIGQALVFSFLVPFAIFLGLSNFQIGVISAMPFASLILSQITTMFLSGKITKRKNFIFYFLFARRVFLVPLLVFPFIKNAPIYFIILVFLVYYLGQVAEAPLISLIADIVPQSIRGLFFAKKELYVAFFTMIPYILAGFFLELFPKNSPAGFIIIFILGILVSFFSLIFVVSVKEPPYKPKKEGLKHFFKFKGEYGKFTFFISVFNFAYMVASPFFVVYIIKNLNFSYSFFVLATSISTICRMLFLKPIGKLMDIYGDKPIAIISTFATALVPLSYLLFVKPQTAFLIIPVEIISGIAWAGFDLSSMNLLLDFTEKNNRMLQVARFNAVTSIPMIIAPMLGGFLSEKSFIFFSGIPLIFALSSIGRALSTIFLFKVKEVRVKKEYPMRIILKSYFYMPLAVLRTVERGFVTFVHRRR
ncbi:MAG: MFS transporter [Candidatus Woesearchaeota archaeon]